MTELTNKERNKEVRDIVDNLSAFGLGPQMDAHVGRANAIASLDVAESLQLLQIQLSQSTKDSNEAVHSTTDRLIESNKQLAKSNDRHSVAMQWLTGALVLVGVIQIVLSLITSHSSN